MSASMWLASCRAAEALTSDERSALTWDEAGRFVLPYPFELARWAELKRRSDITPWQALARLKGIAETV
jgi:hypothetical protein